MARYFNKNLKFIRQKNGISQQELADKLKIDRSTISRWENNDMDATVENAIQVANIFNISIADLTGRDLTVDNDRQLSELEILFQKHKDILTNDDEEMIKFLIEKRKREIDKQLGDE